LSTLMWTFRYLNIFCNVRRMSRKRCRL